MSTNFLRLIPTDPSWLPTVAQEAETVALLRMLAPGRESVVATTNESIVFVDAGANSHKVFCPGCGTEIDWPWWQTQMDVAWKTEFSDLSMTTPCCGLASSLNDLRYDWPQGFSRWKLELVSPDRMGLTTGELVSVGSVLGHEVREIWSHI